MTISENVSDHCGQWTVVGKFSQCVFLDPIRDLKNHKYSKSACKVVIFGVKVASICPQYVYIKTRGLPST